ERELDILGGDHLAVMKPDTLAEEKLVEESIRRHAPRLGQTRRHEVARHRLHYRIVNRVEDHEWRENAGGLGRVEPGRGERNGNSPGHLTFWRRRTGWSRLKRRVQRKAEEESERAAQPEPLGGLRIHQGSWIFHANFLSSSSALPCQNCMSISWYMVVAAVTCSCACSRLPVRSSSFPRPRSPWATSGRMPRSSASACAWRSSAWPPSASN